MKKILPIIVLSFFTCNGLIAQNLAPDQNPNYKQSLEKYLALKDSLILFEGTTLQQTYKAIDFMQAKEDRRNERRADRRFRRNNRSMNRFNRNFDNGFYGYNNFYGNRWNNNGWNNWNNNSWGNNNCSFGNGLGSSLWWLLR